MIRRLIWVLIPGLLILIQCGQNRPPSKPNIIFILVDDLGWSDVGFMGNHFYETPNLDNLASKSMVFTNAYAACAVCSPTRASIMTGKYPARLGITDWIRPFYWRDSSMTVGDYSGSPSRQLLCPVNPYWMDLKELTIAEILRSNGYVTGYIGKWHLGDKGYYPEDQGFGENIGGCDIGQPPSYFDPYSGPLMPDGIHNLEPRDSGQYLTDRLTDEALRFLRSNRDGPFFLFLSHYAVHTPIQAKKDIIDYFRSRNPDTDLYNPVYAAMVKSVDESTGKILNVIDELGIKENTIIIFFSDNGGHTNYTSNAPLRSGKGTPYEGGIREPLMIYWPDRIPGQSECHTPVSSIDFFPTLCQISGLEIPDSINLDGQSITPLLFNENSFEREALFWHFPHYRDYESVTPYSIIRRGNMKLIRYWEGDQELYDLDKDISEKHNLSDSFPDIALELSRKLDQWLTEAGAKLPAENPEYSKGQ